MSVIVVVVFVLGWYAGFSFGRTLGKSEGLLEEARRQRTVVEDLLS